MPSHYRSRNLRTDFALETIFDSLSLTRIRHDTNNLPRFQKLIDGHRNSLLGHFGQIFEPAFADLLAPACFVETDNDICLVCVEIRRRIVKGEMTILPDARK